MAVLEIGKSERKVVWERGNELRFSNVELVESVGRLYGDVGRYLKMCIRGLKGLSSSLEHFSEIENKLLAPCI